MTGSIFGKSNKYSIEEKNGFFSAIGAVYKSELGGDDDGHPIIKYPCAVLMAPVAGTVNYSIHHPGKVAAVVLPAIAVSALTASYFMFPAYAAFVGAYAAKVSAFVAPAIASISGGLSAGFMLAAANPMLAGLLAIIAVAAIGALAYKVYDQRSTIKTQEDMAGQIICELKEDKGVFEEKNGKYTVKEGVEEEVIKTKLINIIGKVQSLACTQQSTSTNL